MPGAPIIGNAGILPFSKTASPFDGENPEGCAGPTAMYAYVCFRPIPDIHGEVSGKPLIPRSLSQPDNNTVMASVADEPIEAARLYSLCLFDRDWAVPEVQLFEAEDDQEALTLASSMRPWLARELWERHRLVRVLPPVR
jgi:hypothetical protein